MGYRKKRPGKLVKCSDGRIGRTYNDEPPVNGKIRVYLFSLETVTVMFARTQEEAQRPVGTDDENVNRLCDPSTLQVIGMAD